MTKPISTDKGPWPDRPPGKQAQPDQGPPYCLNIEGVIQDWSNPTITTEQIIELGGWEPGQGALLVDLKTNEERTLKPGEVVELRPGLGFCKKVKFRRGFDAGRIEHELLLLRAHFGVVDYLPNGRWIIIRSYVLPEGWNRKATDVAFSVPKSLGAAPYGFLVPRGILYGEAKPNDYAEPAKNSPSEGGEWGQFSWRPEGSWKPNGEKIREGSNLLNWAVGFGQRFRAGR